MTVTRNILGSGGRIADRIEALRAHLSAPVSIQSLVVLRILFGGILLWDCWRYIKYTRIERYYVIPEVNFPYFGLSFIQPLPEPWIHILWLGVGLTAALIMLGLFYRVATIGFLVIFGYFFLLDKTQYLNHNYMVLLYAFLLAMAPANRAFSLDAWLGLTERSLVIPRWPVSAIKLQTEIILIYAGIVKITDDWLRGEPLRMWMHARIDDVWIAPIFQYDAILLAAAWGTVALHILGAPLLLWKRTRLPIFVIYCCFHVSNSAFFNIGIFPWLTIAVTTIFFAPDWPQRLLRRGLSLVEELPAPPRANGVAAPRVVSNTLMLVLAAWFAVQIAVPQRQLFFPNLVGWTGDGHRFSWRMRIYDRDAEGHFRVVAADGNYWLVDPRHFLTRRQARAVLTRTDLIHEFAGWLETRWAEDGHGDVAVYAEIQKSLNGRPEQLYIDPQVDLTSVSYNAFGPDPWVLPIESRAAEEIMPAWWPPLPLQKPSANSPAATAGLEQDPGQSMVATSD
ncbi:HTTM domain-containing protein [Ponticoccus sp. SC2-23]|uniref:HTTM domain-containing protein n=1 Tax=Alexandriicola marinus TaxID=2081710 RepID=UPI000FDBA974|nr:HTTM domain-containing protein [Alexandriicola marinus]MBM1219462.1 HTTM domain-containing protein [Ponticoccus sp. SC6-9]MBM1223466.1 HTTM domain-containing protein [Ponticoccus sp. SC6-15]MBM1229275.1 HTTM domain-containing protein [Ponticoccus sp. SC6-38]MBM1232432.1 HTTM domain-containing protein [Ponticoccus sp. SC6-45]MBM1237618.1 HTTM domain-containing protein [Ponticoccus sp. SC6-49]MBM1241443.1 HTTM domain-containing protein [Ponticoccus sp. SC2-64]MBM1245956.1 HTTM domain-contai